MWGRTKDRFLDFKSQEEIFVYFLSCPEAMNSGWPYLNREKAEGRVGRGEKKNNALFQIIMLPYQVASEDQILKHAY